MIVCSAKDCLKPVVAKGLCDMHRQRLKKNGHLEQMRPTDWGTRESHPLYSTWTSLRRSTRSGRCKEWDDFYTFIADVKERPTPNHMLRKVDDALPFSATNFCWQEKLIVKENEETRKAYARRYAAERRKLYPDEGPAADLWKHYRIRATDYDALLIQQNHCCAICKQPETDRTATGDPRRLAVDHCHETGEVRGLLCGACNKGLGYFKDNKSRLEAAINYLKAYDEDQDCEGQEVCSAGS